MLSPPVRLFLLYIAKYVRWSRILFYLTLPMEIGGKKINDLDLFRHRRHPLNGMLCHLIFPNCILHSSDLGLLVPFSLPAITSTPLLISWCVWKQQQQQLPYGSTQTPGHHNQQDFSGRRRIKLGAKTLFKNRLNGISKFGRSYSTWILSNPIGHFILGSE